MRYDLPEYTKQAQDFFEKGIGMRKEQKAPGRCICGNGTASGSSYCEKCKPILNKIDKGENNE